MTIRTTSRQRIGGVTKKRDQPERTTDGRSVAILSLIRKFNLFGLRSVRVVCLFYSGKRISIRHALGHGWVPLFVTSKMVPMQFTKTVTTEVVSATAPDFNAICCHPAGNNDTSTFQFSSGDTHSPSISKRTPGTASRN